MLVSALVCTRNRTDALLRAVASLLQDPDEALELLVIDQSDDTKTEVALQSRAPDARLRYVRSAKRGKGAALNEGLALARGEFVVCTDDDCEAPRGWVSAMARTLEAYPSAAIAFCNVDPVPHDKSEGYVPAYHVKKSRLLSSIADTSTGHGLGAGMALRRQVIRDMGGFDESVGPGARFPSGDDWDITHRALLTGHHVLETAELSILHDGFRSFAEGKKHARRDWIAIGAVCAKPLRAGHSGILRVVAVEFGGNALLPMLKDALALKVPRGFGRVEGFVRGFVGGLLTPVDRERILFSPRRKL